VLLVGVTVFHEKTTWRDWMMVTFAACGVGIILYFESRQTKLEAVVWGLLSGVFFAGVVLALRQLRSFDPAWLAAVNHSATALALLPFSWGESPFPNGIQWLMLAGFGILQMGLPYVLFARGLRKIPGHEASSIGLIEPLLVPVWVYLAWGDEPAWWTIAGGALILTGLALRYVAAPARE
jgi:drug/metabolite transporter (DMT)-like permease